MSTTITCKRVDLWDGGERHNFGFYIEEGVPEGDIKNTYPHCTIRTEVITIFETLDEVKENSIAKLRRSAWLKLSPQERKALNMIEEPKA